MTPLLLECIDCGAPIEKPKRGTRVYCKDCARSIRKCAAANWYDANRKNNPAWKAENARRARLRRQKIKQLPRPPSAEAAAGGSIRPQVPPAPAVRSSLCGNDW